MTRDPRSLAALHPGTALVLGAAVGPDGRPSATLRRRAEHAAALWARGWVGGIVASGGVGRFPPSEAEVIADICRAAGVPSSAIRLEIRARSTAENLAFARACLPGGSAGEVLLVTDLWHMPRALLIARQTGLSVRAAPVPLTGARLGPSLMAALREIPAFGWAALTGWRR